jgi:hypothetical protein
MRRDTMLGHLVGLPAKTNVLMQVGKVQVEIIGVEHGGTLLPHPGDLCDALIASGLPPKQATEVTGHRRNQR